MNRGQKGKQRQGFSQMKYFVVGALDFWFKCFMFLECFITTKWWLYFVAVLHRFAIMTVNVHRFLLNESTCRTSNVEETV